MHVEDIENDLANRDLRGIENAFRALVGWPKEDDIHGLPGTYTTDLLRLVAAALDNDNSIMPLATIEAIENVLGNDCDPMATYAHGAHVVTEYIDRWDSVFHSEQEGVLDG